MEAVFRASTLSETRGFLKALVELNGDCILGFTAFGVGAAEIMTSVQIAMNAGLPHTALRDTILTYPTLVEGLIPAPPSPRFAEAKAQAELTLLRPGDALFLYTDGVYDGSDRDDREKLEWLMRKHCRLPANEICKALLEYALEKDDQLEKSRRRPNR